MKKSQRRGKSRAKAASVASKDANFEEHVVKTQAVVRGFLARKETEKMKLEKVFRNEAAKEMLKTERTYCEQLGILINMFQRPLRAGEKGVPTIKLEDQMILFSNVEMIYKFNLEIKKELEARIGNWTDTTCLGDVFGKLAPFLKMYTQYSNGYDNALDVLSRIRKERGVEKWLNKMKQLPECKGLDLGAYLILPIQRIPRYIMLLEELKKHTPPEHPDVQLITSAVASLKGTAQHLNQSIVQATNMNKIVVIQSQLAGDPPNLVEPHRRFVREGTLTKITSRFRKETYFFLFNDLLVYAYRNPLLGATGKLYRYKGTIPLGPTWIKDLPDVDTVKHAFQIVAPHKTYTVFAETLAEKELWVEAIQKCTARLIKEKPMLENKRASVHIKTRAGFWKLGRGGPLPEDYQKKSALEALPQAPVGKEGEGLKISVKLLSAPVKTGKMTKQGANVRSWKERFFVLQDGFLYYFKETDPEPTGVVPLAGMEVAKVAPSTMKKDNCFSIGAPDRRTYYIFTNSPSDYEAWMKAIADQAKNWGLSNDQGITPLVILLESGVEIIVEQAIRSLGMYVVNDSRRVTLFQSGAVPPLLSLLDYESDLIVREAAALLYSLSLGDTSCRQALSSRDVIEILIANLGSEDAAVAEAIAWTLVILTVEKPPDRPRHSSATGEAVLTPMIALLQSSNNRCQIEASGYIAMLAQDAWHRQPIRDQGGLAPLIAVLTSPTDAVVENAAVALGFLAMNDRNRRAIPQLGAVRPLVKALDRHNPDVQEQCAFALKALVDTKKADKSTLEQIRDEGGVGAFVYLLRSEYDHVLEQATSMVRILSESSVTKTNIRDGGGLPLLVDLMQHPVTLIAEQAARAVANTVLNDLEIIEEVGGIPTVLDLLVSKSMDVQIAAATALVRVTKEENPLYKEQFRKDGGIAIVIDRLYSKNDQLQEPACRVLYNVASLDANKDLIRELHGIKPLILLLSSRSTRVREVAVQTIALLYSNEKNRSQISNSNGLGPLVRLMGEAKNTTTTQRIATNVLTQCAEDEKMHSTLRNEGAVARIGVLLMSTESALVDSAVKLTYKLAKTARKDDDDVNNLPLLLNGLRSSRDAIQEMAAISAQLLSALIGTDGLPSASVKPEELVRQIVVLMKNPKKPVRHAAAIALARIANDVWSRSPIREAGGIPLLVQNLKSSNTKVQSICATGLAHLALNDTNRKDIAKQRGLAPLVEMLASSEASVVEAAAFCLEKMTEGGAHADELKKLHGVEALTRVASGSAKAAKQHANHALVNIGVLRGNASVGRAGSSASLRLKQGEGSAGGGGSGKTGGSAKTAGSVAQGSSKTADSSRKQSRENGSANGSTGSRRRNRTPGKSSVGRSGGSRRGNSTNAGGGSSGRRASPSKRGGRGGRGGSSKRGGSVRQRAAEGKGGMAAFFSK